MLPFRLRLAVIICLPKSKPVKILPAIQSKIFLVSLVAMCCIFGITSCQKELSDYSAHHLKADNSPKAAIVIQNNSPSQIHLTVNGVAVEDNVQPGGKDTLYGTPLADAKIIVETVTVDIDDHPAGEQLVLQYANSFPEDKKSVVQEVNVSPDFYFVKVVNASNAAANQLVVSEPDVYGVFNIDMIISNTKKAIACGYYPTVKQVANIKIIESSNGPREWSFSNVQLPGTANQAITVSCN